MIENNNDKLVELQFGKRQAMNAVPKQAMDAVFNQKETSNKGSLETSNGRCVGTKRERRAMHAVSKQKMSDECRLKTKEYKQ